MALVFRFRYRVLRMQEIVKFAMKLDESTLHDDVDTSDLWDEKEPILRPSPNSDLG